MLEAIAKHIDEANATNEKQRIFKHRVLRLLESSGKPNMSKEVMREELFLIFKDLK